MSYLVGIDGGGTKTAFLLYSLADGSVTKIETNSICPRDHGISVFKKTIAAALSSLTAESPAQIDAICVGIPCRGEDKETDVATSEAMSQLFPGSRITCVNDCVVGYAGALALQPGINIVSGTGAIAYGENGLGLSARSSGWSGEFADEGSCSWLGRKCLELFCKQADNRLPKAALYELVRQELALKDDYDIIKIYDSRLKNSRRELAALQKLLYRAALAGDSSAKAAYSHAADELAQSIEAVRRIIGLSGEASVSYAGGLFKTGELILSPLKARLECLHSGYTLQKPEFLPEEGALLMAARAAGLNVDTIKKNLRGMDRKHD